MADEEDKFIAQMTAAITADGGATPEKGVEAKADDADDAGDEPATEAAETKSEGQPAKPDPWESVKQKYTPEQIAELERAAKDADNAKAMRREASFRNEEAAKLRAEVEADKRAAREALDRVNIMTESLAAISSENPELGAQLLATFKRASGRDAGGDGAGPSPFAQAQRPAAEDKRIAALQAELESLKKGHAELAFGLNTRELTALAWEAVEKDDVLNREAIKALNIPDRVVQNAVESVFQKDLKADPADKINPYDRRALQKAVFDAVKQEAATYGKLRSAIINDYRSEKKAKHAALPPSSKGQSASVRSGPPSSSPPKANAPRSVRESYWVDQMRAASTPVKKGEIA